MSRSRQSIGVGLIGYGYAGSVFHAPLIQGTQGLRLVSVVSSGRDKVHGAWPQVAVDPLPEIMLARPEVALVVIASPNSTHFELARQALLAGKHVVVDKPFTIALEEAVELVGLARRQRRLLSVFHNRRWDSDFLTVRRLLAEGRLGEVAYFESRFDRFRPQVRDRWRERAGPGAGLWCDLGPHLVDQALQLFGPPLFIDAVFEVQRYGAKTDDYFRVRLKYPKLRVILQASMLGADEGPRFVIQGSRGCYVKCGLDPQEAALKCGERPGGGAWGEDPRPGLLTLTENDRSGEASVVVEPGNYLRYYQEIRDAIAAGAPNPVPAEDATLCMRVMAMARESQRLGRPVAFAARVGTASRAAASSPG